MPLSEYEQRVLEQMEQSLASDDPRLATHLGGHPQRSPLRYVIAIIGTLAGIGLLVVGVATSIVLVGVVGFVVMFASVALALAAPSRPESTTSAAGRSGRGKTAGSGRRRSVRQRFEERWDKRQSER